MSNPLIDRIQADMISALKSRNEKKLSALRMLKSSIQLAMTEKGRSKELTEDDVQALIRRAVKQREEASELYIKGGANERAEDELAEAEILKGYLPAQIDDTELEVLITSVIKDTGASGPKDMGRVMSRVMQEANGRADGKRVKDSVTRLLQALGA